MRSKLTLPADSSDNDIEAAALADAKIREHTNGKQPKNVIVVKGKLINIVL